MTVVGLEHRYSVYFMACDTTMLTVGNDGLSTCTTAGYDGMASLRLSEESDCLFLLQVLILVLCGLDILMLHQR